MARSIREKILTAFFTVIALFLTVVVLTAVYNQNAYYKSQKKVEIISAEMNLLNDLSRAMERALMPANDYIITGDKQYAEDFKKEAGTIERLLKDAEQVLTVSHEENLHNIEEEREILRDVRASWKNVNAISARIFALRRPSRNPVATGLMEEMDYKWGRPAIKRLERWHEIETDELNEAVREIHANRTRSWLTMGAVFVILIAGGVYLASYYSKRFVLPIKDLGSGAERIAGGDFDFRVDVKTGDEIEQLANHFNAMAARLKESHSALEEKVRERTRELDERINDLERFKNAVIGRELRMKEIRDELKALREKQARMEKKG